MPHITAITPSPRAPQRMTVRVDGRTAATLSGKLVAHLGLSVGQEWDEGLARRVGETQEYDRVLRQAARWLNRKALSQAEIAGKLRAAGVADNLRQRVTDRLIELGLLDDPALGRAILEAQTRNKPAGPALLRAKMLRRGLSETLVDQLLAQAAQQTDGMAQARQLAQQKMRTLKSLDPATIQRRLWGLLARRGFEEETIAQALDELATEDQD